MKTRASLLLSLVLPLASAGLAYPGEPKPEAAPPAAGHRWELQIVDGVLVKDGAARGPATLRQITDHLVELHPANVVLAPTLGNIQIGNLKLAGFRWESALEALRIASGNQFTWTCQPASTAVDPVTGLPAPGASRNDPPLYVLEPDPAGARRATGRVVEVFNLAGYLQDKDDGQVTEALKEVEGILEQSLDQLRAGGGEFEFDSEPKPSIRFHARARLLVLVGTAEQMDVARKIILAFPGTIPSQATPGTGYGIGGIGGGGWPPGSACPWSSGWCGCFCFAQPAFRAAWCRPP